MRGAHLPCASARMPAPSSEARRGRVGRGGWPHAGEGLVPGGALCGDYSQIQIIFFDYILDKE